MVTRQITDTFQVIELLDIHGNASIGVSMVTQAALSALKMASSDTSARVADELIIRRNQPDFVKQVVNDESKKAFVIETIEASIARLGERVVDELADFKHVNRIYIVGGGAPLIEKAIKTGLLQKMALS
ncbi:StbA protein [Yersinia pekkanenii]|uniref:StbA protein n=2 Tax=Yersinia pekkanenii TaxID=1288385 RepID=A0ABM9TWE6_9GAMM|nr:StbA protein [Yersinia pekkanenii]